MTSPKGSAFFSFSTDITATAQQIANGMARIQQSLTGAKVPTNMFAGLGESAEREAIRASRALAGIGNQERAALQNLSKAGGGQDLTKQYKALDQNARQRVGQQIRDDLKGSGLNTRDINNLVRAGQAQVSQALKAMYDQIAKSLAAEQGLRPKDYLAGAVPNRFPEARPALPSQDLRALANVQKQVDKAGKMSSQNLLDRQATLEVETGMTGKDAGELIRKFDQQFAADYRESKDIQSRRNGQIADQHLNANLETTRLQRAEITAEGKDNRAASVRERERVQKAKLDEIKADATYSRVKNSFVSTTPNAPVYNLAGAGVSLERNPQKADDARQALQDKTDKAQNQNLFGQLKALRGQSQRDPFDAFLGGLTGRGINGAGGLATNLNGLAASAGTVVKFTALRDVIQGISQGLGALAHESLDFIDSQTAFNIALDKGQHVGQEYINSLSDISREAGTNVGEALDTAARAIGAFGDKAGANDATLTPAGRTTAREQVGKDFTATAEQLKLLTGKDLKDVTGDLIAIGNAFGLMPDQLQQVNDAVVNARKNFGGTAGDISQGVAGLGTVASQAGLDLNETANLVALAGSRLDESGTLVATRLSKAFTIIGGASGKQFIAELNAQLTTTGKQANVVDPKATGTESLRQLAGAYKALDPTQQSVLTNRLGGVNSRELITILDNIDEYLDKNKDSANGAGEALDEYHARLKDLTGVITKLTGDLKTLSVGIYNSGLLDVFGLALKAAEPLLNLVSRLVGFYDLMPDKLKGALAVMLELLAAQKLLTGLAGRGIAFPVVGNYLRNRALNAGQGADIPVASRSAVLQGPLLPGQTRIPASATNPASFGAAPPVSPAAAALAQRQAAAAAGIAQAGAASSAATQQLQAAQSAQAAATTKLSAAHKAAAPALAQYTVAQRQAAAATFQNNTAMLAQQQASSRVAALRTQLVANDAAIAAAQRDVTLARQAEAKAQAAVNASSFKGEAGRLVGSGALDPSTLRGQDAAKLQRSLRAERELGAAMGVTMGAEARLEAASAARAATLEAETAASQQSLAAHQSLTRASIAEADAKLNLQRVDAATLGARTALNTANADAIASTGALTAATAAQAAAQEDLNVANAFGRKANAYTGKIGGFPVGQALGSVGRGLATGAEATASALLRTEKALADAGRAAGSALLTGARAAAAGDVAGAKQAVTTLVDGAAAAGQRLVQGANAAAERLVATGIGGKVASGAAGLGRQLGKLFNRPEGGYGQNVGALGTIGIAAAGAYMIYETQKKVSAILNATDKVSAQLYAAGGSTVESLRQAATDLDTKSKAAKESSGGIVGSSLNFILGDPVGQQTKISDSISGYWKGAANALGDAQRQMAAGRGGYSGTPDLDVSTPDALSASLKQLTDAGRDGTTVFNALYQALDQLNTGAGTVTTDLNLTQGESRRVAISTGAKVYQDLVTGNLNFPTGKDAAPMPEVGSAQWDESVRQGASDQRLFDKADKTKIASGMTDEIEKFRQAHGGIIPQDKKDELIKALQERMKADYGYDAFNKLSKDYQKGLLNEANVLVAQMNAVRTAEDPTASLQALLSAAPDAAALFAANAGLDASLNGAGDPNSGNRSDNYTGAAGNRVAANGSLVAAQTELAKLQAYRDRAIDKNAKPADLENINRKIQEAEIKLQGVMSAYIDSLTQITVAQNPHNKRAQLNAQMDALNKKLDPNAEGHLTDENDIAKAKADKANVASAQADQDLEDAAAARADALAPGDQIGKLKAAQADAEDKYNQLKADPHAGQAELARAHAAMIAAEADYANYDAAYADQLALAALDPRNLLAAATAKAKISADKLARDKANHVTGDQLIGDTQSAVADAIAASQAQLDDASSSRAVNIDPRDTVGQATEAKRRADDYVTMLQAAKVTGKTLNDAIIESRKAAIDALNAQADADEINALGKIDITDPAERARISAQKAAEKLRQAQASRADPTTIQDLTNQSRQADADSENTALQQRLAVLKSNLDLGRISQQTYIQGLYAEKARLESIGKLTYEQDQALRSINQTIKDSASAMDGSFNIGDIKLPTLYEVRTSIANQLAANTGSGGGQTVNVTINGGDLNAVKQVLGNYLGPQNFATTTLTAGKV